MPNELDALLAGLDIGSAGTGANNKANTGAKKGNADAKAGDKKQKPPIETLYEGYTIQPLTPAVGEKKTWAKVAKNSLPFNSVKLYEMATAHRQRTGKSTPAQFRELGSNQQGVITRILEEKQLDELDADAVWELYHVRPLTKEVSKTIFRSNQAVYQIEVIICRKDRRKGLVDKPSSMTTNPQRVQGEIIDLTVPLVAKTKKNIDNKKSTPKAPRLSEAEMMNILGDIEPKMPASQDRQPQPRQPDHNGYIDHQLPPGVDLNRHFWNGEFWEEREPALSYPHQPWDPRWQHDPPIAQPQQNLYHYQQHPPVPPPAPMPIPMQMPMQDHNPFQPMGTHPEQFVDMPQNMDPRAQPDHIQHASVEPRTRTRSRSRSLHRRHSRRRSRHGCPPSMSSSEADYYSDFTPPSTPPSEEYVSAGSLHRRSGQRYYREKRTRYPNERYELRPATTRRIEYDDDYRPSTTNRARPILVHDDYPRPRRRITDFADAQEEADFRRPRWREHEMDPLRYGPRRDRHEEVRRPPRRYSGL